MSRDCDLLIVGGGVGGCAAAMAAVSRGLSVILTEETDWIGGQLTAQGVPPDEHPWIEEFGCTRRYREFRDRVRLAYKGRSLVPEALADPHLNPGGGWVSRLCCEPAVAWEVLWDMVHSPAPDAGGSLRILHHCKPVAAATEHDQIQSVTVWNVLDGSEKSLSAHYVIDATELGDILPLSGAEYVSGAESKSDTGEPNAVEGDAEPDNVQGLTWCFALELNPLGGVEGVAGLDPEQYTKWSAFKPAFWPGPLLGFEVLHAHTGEPRTLPLFRNDGDPYALFSYRQIVNPALYAEPYFPPVTLVNWPQNDYFEASIIDVDPPGSRSAFPGASGPVSEARLKDSIQLSLSLLNWLRTEAPRHDGGTGYPECGLARDIWKNGTGLAKYPYVRESRRIRARKTIVEQDIAAYTNPGLDRAALCGDSVGIGAYRIDLHPSTNGANTIDTSTLPFQIPLGAMIPVRLRNLIPGCKNIGTTHITNGCYRLHPVEWNIGEAAGLLAAMCVLRKVEPAEVYESPELVVEFQRLLTGQGVELEWPNVPLKPL